MKTFFTLLMIMSFGEAWAAGGGAHGEGVPVYMVIKQAVNFGIFLFLLSLIVKKFVPPFFSERYEKFMAHKKQAQQLREQAQQKLQHMQADLSALQQQKSKRLQDVEREAEKQAQLKISEAQAAADKLQQSTLLRLKKSWARKMRQLYSAVLQQALDSTQTSIDKLPPAQQQQWQKDFLTLLERELTAHPSKQPTPLPQVSQVALPYARALYEWAQQNNKIDIVLQQLECVHRAFDVEAQDFFASPFVSQLQRQQVLTKVLGGLKLLPEVKNFITLLAQKGRLLRLGDVVQAYKFQHDVRQGALRGQVQGLPAEGQRQLEQLVSKLAGQKLSVSDTSMSAPAMGPADSEPATSGLAAASQTAASGVTTSGVTTSGVTTSGVATSGVVLQLGGQSFDYSVACHLSKLKANLTRRAEELWN